MTDTIKITPNTFFDAEWRVIRNHRKRHIPQWRNRYSQIDDFCEWKPVVIYRSFDPPAEAGQYVFKFYAISIMNMHKDHVVLNWQNAIDEFKNTISPIREDIVADGGKITARRLNNNCWLNRK